MADRIIQVQPAPFPGFDDTIIDVTGENVADRVPGQETTEQHDDAGAGAVASGATGEAKPAPIDLSGLYVDPLNPGGPPVTGQELRDRMLLQADYTRKRQELAPFEKQFELYRISPKFRAAVDKAGAETLGIDLGESGAEPLDKQKLTELFDQDPVAAMQELLKAERRQATAPKPTSDDKVELLFAQAQAHIGEDWSAVEQRIRAKVPTMTPEEQRRVDTDATAMFRLIYDTHRDLLKERAAPPGDVKTTPSATSRAAVSDAGGAAAETGGSPKSVWQEDRKAFQARVDRVLKQSPHTALL